MPLAVRKSFQRQAFSGWMIVSTTACFPAVCMSHDNEDRALMSVLLMTVSLPPSTVLGKATNIYLGLNTQIAI